VNNNKGHSVDGALVGASGSQWLVGPECETSSQKEPPNTLGPELPVA